MRLCLRASHCVNAGNNSCVSRVSNRRSIGGDSGGGYSWGLGAIGSHAAGGGTKQYYSPMGTVIWFYNLELAQ